MKLLYVTSQSGRRINGFMRSAIIAARQLNIDFTIVSNMDHADKKLYEEDCRTYYDSEEKEMVGRACRELEHALAANLTTPNLLKASDAISTIAEVLNSNEQRLNEK